MASIYIKAGEELGALCGSAIRRWHPDLQKVELRVGILYVLSARETQDAIKENGHKVKGAIKIVPLKDRVTKGFDVEVLIDGDDWKNSTPNAQIALVDHLLSRLEIKKPKPKKKKKTVGSQGAVHGSDDERADHEEAEFITDDIGRPVLKIRKGDWNAGYGFRSVVERHGRFSPEYDNVMAAQAIVDEAVVDYDKSLVEQSAEVVTPVPMISTKVVSVPPQVVEWNSP